MRLLTVEGHWSTRHRTPKGRTDLEAGLIIEWPARWVRLAVFWGEAPGSHMAGKHAAWWISRWGPLRGVNARFGWWPEPCLTLLAHTHPAREHDRWAVTAKWDVGNLRRVITGLLSSPACKPGNPATRLDTVRACKRHSTLTRQDPMLTGNRCGRSTRPPSTSPNRACRSEPSASP